MASKAATTPQQANISNVPKKDSNGKPIPNTTEGTLVRIRLFDDRERVLLFKDNPSPTARQVCTMIAQKLDMTDEAAKLFSLWIVGSELQLQIRPKMELQEMVDKWPRWLEKYTHATDIDAKSFKFVFKREAMVNREMEKALTDDVAIKLLYGEVRTYVMSGRYPLSNLSEAVHLGAIQLCISHGEYNSAKHGPGTGFIPQSITTLVPKYMIGKQKVQDWEMKLASAWSNLPKKTNTTGYTDFLNHARQWDHYGATFFAACKNVPPQGYFELRTDHLFIAVSRYGLAIIDHDRNKISWYGDYEGIEWECTPDTMTIEFRPPTGPDGIQPKKMASTMISPQAHLIDSLASRAIYLIEKEQKKGVKAPAKAKSGSQPPTPASPPPAAKNDRRLSVKPAATPKTSEEPEPTTPTKANQKKRVSSIADEGATMIVSDDEDGGNAAYLKAIQEVRTLGNKH